LDDIVFGSESASGASSEGVLLEVKIWITEDRCPVELFSQTRVCFFVTENPIYILLKLETTGEQGYFQTW